MLTLADIAAIEAAIWAHASGVSYLAKIEQALVQATACGNQCCSVGSWLFRIRRRLTR